MAKLQMQTGFAQTAIGGGGKTDFEPIPSGTYNAYVETARYQDVNKEICHWKTEDKEFNFRFRIADGEEHAKRVFFFDARPELTDSPKCRLRLILEALFQVNRLGDDFELDVDDLSILEGRPCRLRIEKYVKQNGQEGNKVTDVLPPLGGGGGNIDNVSFTPPPQPQPLQQQAYDDIPF